MASTSTHPGTTAAGDESPLKVPPLPARWAAVITASVAILIMLAEIGRLTGQIVSPKDQRPHVIESLVGPATFVSFKATATAEARVAGWESDLSLTFLVTRHTLLDLVLVIGWLAIWRTVLRRIDPDALTPMTTTRCEFVRREVKNVHASWPYGSRTL